MQWLGALDRLRRERRPGVLVTLVTVRGHAPRDAGAKMVVAAGESWGSIGGGNLEATAMDRARAMLAGAPGIPELVTLQLNDKAPVEHGQQCCGGEVTILLEPLAVVPAVAIFGMGHVGLELARVLAAKLAGAANADACVISRLDEGSTQLQTLGIFGAVDTLPSYDVLEYPLTRRVLRDAEPAVVQVAMCRHAPAAT